MFFLSSKTYSSCINYRIIIHVSPDYNVGSALSVYLLILVHLLFISIDFVITAFMLARERRYVSREVIDWYSLTLSGIGITTVTIFMQYFLSYRLQDCCLFLVSGRKYS